MRFSTHGRREGFALAVAIFAIAAIGGLIAGVFFASTQEFRIGRNTLLQTRALTAAEHGQNKILSPAEWNTTWNTALAPGGVVVREFKPGDGSVDTVRLTRLSTRSFLAVSEGHAGWGHGAQASRRIGTLIRLNIPDMAFPGALTTRGPTTVGGSSQISGHDTDPAGWDCPPSEGSKPGIVTPDEDYLKTNGSGCNGFSCVQGDPKINEDPAAADTNTYFKYGDMDWSDLTAMATKLPSGNIQQIEPRYQAGGSCDMAHPQNWGDPRRNVASPGACEGYFPIIYAPGDLAVNGKLGQGVLLVEGNLDVAGGFEFYGPVIVRGRLKTSGQGGHFNGGVMAADVELDGSTVTGNAVVTYSGCAIARALSGSAMPVVAGGRAWVELYR